MGGRASRNASGSERRGGYAGESGVTSRSGQIPHRPNNNTDSAGNKSEALFSTRP